MKTYLILVLSCLVLSATAQKTNPIKFGKITPAELEKKVYAIDSNAHAVVLYDKGSTDIVGNDKGWFSLLYKQHKRIHILDKNGYDQADIEIPLYTNGDDEEKLYSLKAVTYNLENGTVVESKLEKSAVFTEKRSKNLIIKKFTLPGVKEGSVIEYEFEMRSDFLSQAQPWAFQGSAPRLWSEYSFTVPQFFKYAFLSQGHLPFFISDKKDRTMSFTVREDGGAYRSETHQFSSGVTEYRWVMKDVPELKKESYTSTLKNHIAKIDFQLSAFAHPLTPRTIMSTWPELTKELLKSEYFGGNLGTMNGWLSDVVKPLTATGSEAEKAQNIFAYVRDNFTCTDYSSVYMDQSLKNVLKTKKGNISEINLLLTAMLLYADIKAEPVILSTSDHGYTNPFYPLISRFNYVVCKANVAGGSYMLDASRPRLGFGKMMPECYNGHARVVNEAATPLDFVADSLTERKLTSVFVANKSDGKWVGAIQQKPGYFESYNIRDKVKEKGQEEFFKELEKALGADITISQPEIEALNAYNEPVNMKYSVDLKTPEEEILYVNPMFGEGIKDNPFKSAERYYPVEMPYASDVTYVLNLEVPKGYTVDELPKQVAVKLNEEGEGYFEYLVSQSNNVISLRSRLKLQRATYTPEEYDYLREFFNLVVNKHNEQIVLKKIK